MLYMLINCNLNNFFTVTNLTVESFLNFFYHLSMHVLSVTLIHKRINVYVKITLT